MEMDSITASAACGAVILPFDASARLTGSVPRSVDGNRAKASFIVIQVEESHWITKVL